MINLPIAYIITPSNIYQTYYLPKHRKSYPAKKLEKVSTKVEGRIVEQRNTNFYTHYEQHFKYTMSHTDMPI